MEGPRSGKSFRSLGWTGRGCRRVGWGWEHEGWRRPSWGAEKGINSCWTETLEGTGYGVIVYTTHKTHKYVCIYLYVCMYDVYIYIWYYHFQRRVLPCWHLNLDINMYMYRGKYHTTMFETSVGLSSVECDSKTMPRN